VMREEISTGQDRRKRGELGGRVPSPVHRRVNRSGPIPRVARHDADRGRRDGKGGQRSEDGRRDRRHFAISDHIEPYRDHFQKAGISAATSAACSASVRCRPGQGWLASTYRGS
jgi:hypothetical protein